MEPLGRKLGGRVGKWVTGGIWLVVIMLAAGAFAVPEKFKDAEKNESTSFLPGDSESVKALKKTERIQDGEQAPLVIVYRRDGGLTAADRQRIRGDLAELNTLEFRNLSRFAPMPPGKGGELSVSPDRSAALIQALIEGDGESDTLLDPVTEVRERVSGSFDGLEVAATGGAGFAADQIEVFENINGTLLLAAGSLVLLLLILIYRSPIFWIIPIIAVAFAEVGSQIIGFGLTELGVTVNGQSSSILSVLVLGAGTDYALLLVSRYREELRRVPDRHEALARAYRTAGPAIFASGMTVIAALLCLTLADLNGTAGLGPIGAVGVATAMLSMLTLLPALLVIFGRWVFWPFIPHVQDEGADATHGAWRNVAERVSARPRRVWIGVAALLVVLSLGSLNYSDGLTSGNGFRDDVEAVRGQELVSKSFPGGANAPTDVVVPTGGDVPAVAQAVNGAPGVESVQPVDRGEEGTLLQATLAPDPFSTEAFDLVPGLRAAAHRAGGEETLVGGATAVEFDTRQAAARDTKLIVPIALLVVFLVLMALLRAVVAPVLLILTVILSFAASLGVGAIVFDVIFGFPGSDPSLPLFAFVFLVALGIDYNIFLMARVREETIRHGTREGMKRGLAVTGGVITAAGVVLAGTFSVLAVLPLVFLTQIGFVIAFGVLLDTFIVRSLLVPALTFELGPRIWWPSTLSRSIDRSRFEPRQTVGAGTHDG